MTSSRERFCLKHFHSLITNGRQLTWFLSICWEKNEWKLLIGDVSTWSCRKMKFRLRRIKKDETRPGLYKFTAHNDVITQKTDWIWVRPHKNYTITLGWMSLDLGMSSLKLHHNAVMYFFLCGPPIVGSLFFWSPMIVIMNLTHALNCLTSTAGPWNSLSITLFKWLMIASRWLDGLMNGGK